MSTCKFKIGDMVIGNDESKYCYTRKGWKGRVIKVYKKFTITR